MDLPVGAGGQGTGSAGGEEDGPEAIPPVRPTTARGELGFKRNSARERTQHLVVRSAPGESKEKLPWGECINSRPGPRKSMIKYS